MKRRTLPERCYDFFTYDGWDGEETGPFSTLAAAKEARRVIVQPMKSWNRSRISVTWRLNEKKIRALLVVEHAQDEGGGSDK